MNNAWISIALRAPCARQPSYRPLAHLYRTTTSRSTFLTHEFDFNSRGFSSTSRWLAVKKKQSHKAFPPKQKTVVSKTLLHDTVQSNEIASTPPTTPPISSPTPSTDEPSETLTWRDYDPEGGMPLPNGELQPEQIQTIFGNGIEKDTGNYVLNVLNWRRRSGALIDVGVDVPRWSGVTRGQALMALDYIRDQDPNFDEQAAGQRWVEEETERQRLEIQDRSVRLGLYKASPETLEEEGEQPPELQQGTEEGRKRSGESALIQERQRREAEWEEQQVQEAREAEQKEVAAMHAQRGPLELGGGVQPSGALVKHDPAAAALAEQRERTQAWKQKWEDKATISKTQEIPQMTLLSRLGPAFLVLLSSSAVAWLFYSAYAPPPTSARMWPDIPPSIATVSAVTAALIISAVACRFPPFWPFVSRFMTIVPAYPYAASIVGAVFRHDRLQHLVSNLVVLWLVGPTLHEDVGRGGFLAILLASAAFGGFSSLTYEVLTKSWSSYVFGASNAILGLFAATCTIQPNRTIHVLSYDIPFAAWIFLALNLSAETVGLIAGYGPRLGIDFAGHIGGQLCGFGIALYLRSMASSKKGSDTASEST